MRSSSTSSALIDVPSGFGEAPRFPEDRGALSLVKVTSLSFTAASAMCQYAGVKPKIATVPPGRAGAKSRSEAERRFAQVLLKRASAPDLRKTERTRLRLLASIAGQLSDGREHADLRVADVTAAADLAHGTFYRYFPDLRSAVEALVTDFAAFLHDQLMRTRDGTSGSRDRVRGATLAYTRAFRANAGLMRCLISLGREETHFSKAFQNLKDRKSTRLNSSHTVISYAV